MSGPALAWYVYCVVPADNDVSFDGLTGVDPEFGVRVLTSDAVSAVVSPVGLSDFGAEALRRNLEDLAGLERTARAHDAVLARAMTGEAVVPLRLCTIFAEEHHVLDMLGRERARLLDELDRLRGHAEWSVKILADRNALEAAARRTASMPVLAGTSSDAPGHAYLARKKEDHGLRELARAMVDAAVEEAHARLTDEATTAVLLRLQNPDVSQRPGHMVLNGAYLVHRSRAGAFTAVVRELGEAQRDRGLRVELAGPWAPYSFVTTGEAPE
jgi:hypothetical protein